MANTNHGVVVQVGELAYQAVTPGLDYSRTKRRPKVGDWVTVAKHAGARRSIILDMDRPQDRDPLNLIHVTTVTDTDILDVGTHEQMKRVAGWL